MFVARTAETARLHALDAAVGEELWHAPVGGQVAWSSPTVADGRVIVGSADRGVYAFDAASGDELWHSPVGEGVASSPTVADGRVFVGNNDSRVYALDAASGDELWHHGGYWPIVSSPTVAGDAVFVGTSGAETNLLALDAASGDVTARYAAAMGIWSSPTVAGGRVYVGDHAGRLRGRAVFGPTASDGSRVSLGTLGHHGGWRHADQSVRGDGRGDTATASATDAETATATGADTETGRATAVASDGVPGFGVPVALAALGALGHWIGGEEE